MAGNYPLASYVSALQRLLPRGRVWPRSADATQTALVNGIMPTYVRSDAAAQALLIDIRPDTTSDLLPEWEETLGLPDPCLGGSPTIDQRKASVLARFTAVGGDTRQFLIDYAAALGYTITVVTNGPFLIGSSGMGDAIGDSSWYSVLTIVCATLDAVLECELQAVAPADVQLIFET